MNNAITSQTIDSKYYKNVPNYLVEKLQEFRDSTQFKSVTIGETEWEYFITGSGVETIILLPGEARYAQTWFLHILALREKYRIIAPNMPKVNKVSKVVDGIKSLIELEGIKQVSFIGTCSGGIIAQCFVRKYPDLVKHLIISNSAGNIAQYANKFKRWLKVNEFVPSFLLPYFWKKGLRYRLPCVKEEFSFWKAFDNEMTDKYFTKTDVVGEYWLLIDFACNYQFKKEDLENWTGKVFIMDSDNDEFILASMRKSLKELYPQAITHTFPAAGHVVAITRRDEYLRLVTDFLKMS